MGAPVVNLVTGVVTVGMVGVVVGMVGVVTGMVGVAGITEVVRIVGTWVAGMAGVAGVAVAGVAGVAVAGVAGVAVAGAVAGVAGVVAAGVAGVVTGVARIEGVAGVGVTGVARIEGVAGVVVVAGVAAMVAEVLATTALTPCPVFNLLDGFCAPFAALLRLISRSISERLRLSSSSPDESLSSIMEDGIEGGLARTPWLRSEVKSYEYGEGSGDRVAVYSARNLARGDPTLVGEELAEDPDWWENDAGDRAKRGTEMVDVEAGVAGVVGESTVFEQGRDLPLPLPLCFPEFFLNISR
jgi:hypothetical protein